MPRVVQGSEGTRSPVGGSGAPPGLCQAAASSAPRTLSPSRTATHARAVGRSLCSRTFVVAGATHRAGRLRGRRLISAHAPRSQVSVPGIGKFWLRTDCGTTRDDELRDAPASSHAASEPGGQAGVQGGAASAEALQRTRVCRSTPQSPRLAPLHDALCRRVPGL